MKTTDLFKINRSSQRLNEGLEKFFGQNLSLESFDLPQLEDARNKLRTQISQVRGESGFNENLENDAYSKAQWMLDAINAEIAEREEFIADAGTADVRYEEGSNADATLAQIAAAGDGYYDMLQNGLDGLLGGEVEIILHDMYDEVSREYHLHPDDDFEEIHNRMIDRIEQDYGQQENIAPQSMGESTQGNNMRKLREGEIQQASAIVTAKTMVDRVGRWIEELSGMENDTLLQLGDQIRDEMSSGQAKQFIGTVAPAIQTALDTLKQTRETLSTGVRTLTGEEQPAEMLGAEAPNSGEDELGAVAPDAMNTGEEEMGAPEDEFTAAEPAAGGIETAGREKRESIEYQNNLLRVLAG